MTGRMTAVIAGIVACIIPITSLAETSAKPPVQYGTTITFHGWSPNSQFVAYTWVQVARPKPPRTKPVTIRRRLNRRIWKGKLSTYGPGSGRDIVAYAKRKKYQVEKLKGQHNGKASWTFKTTQALYRFQVVAGKKLRWELYRDGKLIAKESCKGLYVDVLPTLYPSPNRQALLLHLRQNTGWRWDDSLAVIGLEPHGKKKSSRR